MLIYILRKLLGAIATLVVVTFLIFIALQRLVPGTEASVLAGGTAATPAAVHAIEVKLGLTRPLVVQYGSWIANAVQGNLGVSAISGLPVAHVLAQEAPESLELGLLALIIASVVGVPLGVAAALGSGKWSDSTIRIPFLVLFGIPFFVTGSLLLLFGAEVVPWAYSASYVPLTQGVARNMQALALPALSAGLPVSALLLQMTRSAMLDVLAEPYITTARACGIKARRIYYVHALKAALPPILALEGFTFGILIGSLIVIEDVFSLPGLGSGLLTSFGNRDFVELEGQILVLSASFIIGNLIVDLLLPIIDKRIATR